MELLIDMTKIRGTSRDCAKAPETYAVKKGSTIFPNIEESLPNSRRPEGDIKLHAENSQF
jgi:hypothetical protein